MKANTQTKGIGEKCPKCGESMQRKYHTKAPKTKSGYHFSEWDFCSTYAGGCGHVQHYEKYKTYTIKPNNKSTIVFKNY